MILRTIEYAVPVLIRAIIGILPFFIGYAILGQCLFWEIEFRFGSFSYAFFSLFAMMNGDNLIPIHNDVIYSVPCFIFGSFTEFLSNEEMKIQIKKTSRVVNLAKKVFRKFGFQ